jgi:hypothetical protein
MRSSVVALAIVAAIAASVPAHAADYRDAQNAFSLDLDETVWKRSQSETGDLRIECHEKVCGKVSAMCSFRKFKLPAGLSDGLANFDGPKMAEAQRTGFAKLKEVFDSKLGADKNDVPAEITRPYSLAKVGALTAQVAEFRMTLVGDVIHYRSFVMGVPGFRLVIMCQSHDKAFGETKPRFEALVARLRDAPL